MKKLNILGIAVITTLISSSCYYDNFKELKPESALNSGSGCDTIAAISYSVQIVPILTNNCTGGCHNGIGSGHDMTNYTAVKADAVANKFLESVNWDGSVSFMPQGATSKIQDCDIAKIRLWITQGATNN